MSAMFGVVILTTAIHLLNAQLHQQLKDGKCEIVLGDDLFTRMEPNTWKICPKTSDTTFLGHQWSPALRCRCEVKNGETQMRVTDGPYFGDDGRCKVPEKKGRSDFNMEIGKWLHFCPQSVLDHFSDVKKGASKECRCLKNGNSEQPQLEARDPAPFMANDNKECRIRDGISTSRAILRLAPNAWLNCPEGIKAIYPSVARDDCMCEFKGGEPIILFRNHLNQLENGYCQIRDKEEYIHRYPVDKWIKPCSKGVLDQFGLQDATIDQCRCLSNSTSEKLHWEILKSL